MNIALSMLVALAFHFLGIFPDSIREWVADNLKNALRRCA
jgi:hypothetical protein